MEIYKEYKVSRISEGGCSAVLFGNSSLPLKKIQNTFNNEAKDGWSIVFQVVEQKRLWLFWSRESMIVTFGR
tara:strand:- start:416 stop:631 length:216 start_codon:yes stop_codon:yes gene_type:complete